jgi:hypothetical protein
MLPVPASLRKMKTFLVACGLVWCAAGCASRERAPAFAPPSEEELPNITFPQTTFPVSVGVIGQDRNQPRVVMVPEFKPAEPTPEEQKILDTAPKKAEYDFLALYPGKPSETVIPSATAGGSVTVYRETGGASAGRIDRSAKSGVFDESGATVSENPRKVISGAFRGPKDPVAGQAGEHREMTSVNPSKHISGVDRHVERD